MSSALDLGLDPSDPLNLLLNNNNSDSSMDESSQGATSPPDWSQLSFLWPPAEESNQTTTTKGYSEMMDFSELGNLDMDFNPMSIEPSALYFDSSAYNSFGETNFLANNNNSLGGSAAYPFPFPHPSSLSSDLSTASLSPSDSGSSEDQSSSVSSPQTPIMSNACPVMASPIASKLDPAAELAQRVRETAGVMMAVPMGAQQYIASQASNASHVAAQSKLPIPRLPRPDNNQSRPFPAKSTASPSPPSSAASTPPPTTPPPSGEITNGPHMSVMPNVNAAAFPRPKTSHTTIERRYRTNLNARIQSLRMSVPALRVLENTGELGSRKIKGKPRVGKGKGEGENSNDDGEVDVIDERGFVDGVKVARKCSKANVLGKAVEYIRVLKKREHRLKAEQSGLKSLVSGLVGGPALLREWEREWREKFGGPERDEIEGDSADADGDDSDEDDEDGDGDDDSSASRKRKRVKVAAAPVKSATTTKEKVAVKAQPVDTATVPTVPGVPEKRKRGRPRKVIPPPPTASAPLSTSVPVSNAVAAPILPPGSDHVMSAFVNVQPPQQQQQQQQHHYLLAVFALFSFFNSPLTASTGHPAGTHTAHGHTGTVLSSHPPHSHNFVMSPSAMAGNMSSGSERWTMTAAAATAGGWGWREWLQFIHLGISLFLVARLLVGWLGAGRVRVVIRKRLGLSWTSSTTDDKLGVVGIEGWAKRAEEIVINDHTPNATRTTLFTRLQTYHHLSSYPAPSPAHLALLSFLVYTIAGGFGRARARSLWEYARERAERGDGKSYERMLVEGVSVEQAIEMLRSALSSSPSPPGTANEVNNRSPIVLLAGLVVKTRVRKHLGEVFVRNVLDADLVDDDGGNGLTPDEVEGEFRRTVEALRSLELEEVSQSTSGGLARVVERVWKTNGFGFDTTTATTPLGPLVHGDDTAEAEKGVDGEIASLLEALTLYRDAFAASSTSSAFSFTAPSMWSLSASSASSASSSSYSTSFATPPTFPTKGGIFVVGGGGGGQQEETFLLSPPPSPSPRTRTPTPTPASTKREQEEQARLKNLRRVLGSRVFEDAVLGEGVEDARDRVVDLIVERERRERW